MICRKLITLKNKLIEFELKLGYNVNDFNLVRDAKKTMILKRIFF